MTHYGANSVCLQSQCTACARKQAHYKTVMRRIIFIAAPVSISGMEVKRTWTDVDAAPSPSLAEEIHLITGLTGQGHRLFRPKALSSLYHTLY